MNWRNNSHTCWTISAIVSYVHLRLSCKCEGHFLIIHLSNTVHKTFLSLIIPFMRTHEPNKLTCSHLSSFVAQLVRTLYWHCRGYWFESCWRCLKIFRYTYQTVTEIFQQVWGSFLQFSNNVIDPRTHQWKVSSALSVITWLPTLNNKFYSMVVTLLPNTLSNKENI